MAIRRLAKRLETDKALATKVKRVVKILFVEDVTPSALRCSRARSRLADRGFDFSPLDWLSVFQAPGR